MNASRKPTQRELDEARDYIVRRLGQQDVAESELARAIDDAAESIALIVLKYLARGMMLRFSGNSAMAREIDDVMSALRGKIRSIMEEMAAPDEETLGIAAEKAAQIADKAIAYAAGTFHGATFGEREELYVNRLLDDMKAVDFTSLGMDEAAMVSAIIESAESTRERMALLMTNTVAVGWMYAQMLRAKDDGAAGFWLINGSRPCDYCKGMAGFHPMSDPMPPYHPRCVCTAVYV